MWPVWNNKTLHGILSPMKMGGFIFQGQWGVCLFLWAVGGLLQMEGITIRDFPGRLQYKFLVQLANAGPKFVKVNWANCHREVCRIKFYQIVTSDVLTSCHNLIKCYFDNLESSKGSQVFSEMLNPHQYNYFIVIVKSSYDV